MHGSLFQVGKRQLQPMVIAYSGHRIGARFAAEAEGDVALRIRALLGRIAPLAGYGSLAAGADILIAEALLARSVPVHVWLPYEPKTFADVSVDTCGPGWRRRFSACLKHAASTTVVETNDETESPFGRCADEFLRAAAIRARAVGRQPLLVAIWDGLPGTKETLAGTAADVDRAQTLEFQLEVIVPAIVS